MPSGPWSRPALVLLLLCVAGSALGQGLRESALELLAELEAATGFEACRQADSAEALLAEIEAADAERFMEDETSRLREAATAARDACPATPQPVANPGLEQLHARCLALGEARAHCTVRAECAAVAAASPRMSAFWAAALAVPCPR